MGAYGRRDNRGCGGGISDPSVSQSSPVCFGKQTRLLLHPHPSALEGRPVCFPVLTCLFLENTRFGKKLRIDEEIAI